MNENIFIKNYLAKLVKKNSAALKLNDDVFFDKKSKTVISVDTYVEKTHFPSFDNPKLLIKKVIRSSISDLICKGVVPKFYFISGSGNKKSFTKKNINKIISSLKSEQKKFSIKLSGGDTVYSQINSFTVISLGFSNKIVKRNNAKINDDIYLTGELGDSYLGLKYLQKKNFEININKKYFINKFYLPKINSNFSKYLTKFANTSIDISDGLLIDLNKMINNQNISYEIYCDKIPISNNLKIFLKKNSLEKNKFIFNGDDYQILFTAKKSDEQKIQKISRKTNTKITKIGKILSKKKFKSKLLNGDKVLKLAKMPGYEHFFT
ncbi:thiamine-phosphate kinase [Candidatus Pelagibacter communis]|uniref:thiamine-phosphate kinase n=1 Tax=Pelagibacter ubique TaxID=198252 RepID=UPI00094C2102|nr:thiamine-phosphate kinase [Candidatus Pelagibacter ubique]